VDRQKAFYGAGLILLALTLAACADGDRAPAFSEEYTGTALSGPAADFEFLDQSGAAIRLSRFRGDVVVLTFLDTLCTDVCPLTSAELRRAHQLLGPDASAEVVCLAVNVNAEANSLEDVSAAMKKWRLDEIETFHFLTGAEVELAPVWEAYHVTVYRPPDQAEELLHTPGVFLIDRAGELRWYVSTPYDESGRPEGTAPLSELLAGHIRDLLAER